MGGGLTLDELRALDSAGAALVDAMRRLQKLPATLERDPLALSVQRLEECEFWLHKAMELTVKNRARADAEAAEIRNTVEELAEAPRCPGCSWVLRRKEQPAMPERLLADGSVYKPPEHWCCDNCGRSFEACELTFPVRIGIDPNKVRR